ncbi:hypothetical protein IBX73_10540, partial [candidate division WOR-3 bacterium]|nr:hypothetical protein [candidate division WOR-3 bacterium]
MKRYAVGALLLALAATPFARGNADVGTDNVIAGPYHLSGEGVVIEGISPGFRIRTPGSNILVCEHGTDVAALYGVPLYPNNMTGLKIAYSINAGAVWSRYGPFGAGQSMQCAMDGPPNFCQTGGLAFIWSDGSSLNVMLEENTPSAPSFSVPLVLPNSQSPVMYPRNPDIAMAPDDITNFVATAWSVFGNQWVYCWVSNDGGYTWTDTIPMAFIASDGASGCLSRGTDDHVLYAYLDYYTFAATDSVIYPYYIESTDGGYTWGPETPVPDVPINANSMFWWSEFDCLVIN